MRRPRITIIGIIIILVFLLTSLTLIDLNAQNDATNIYLNSDEIRIQLIDAIVWCRENDSFLLSSQFGYTKGTSDINILLYDGTGYRVIHDGGFTDGISVTGTTYSLVIDSGAIYKINNTQKELVYSLDDVNVSLPSFHSVSNEIESTQILFSGTGALVEYKGHNFTNLVQNTTYSEYDFLAAEWNLDGSSALIIAKKPDASGLAINKQFALLRYDCFNISELSVDIPFNSRTSFFYTFQWLNFHEALFLFNNSIYEYSAESFRLITDYDGVEFRYRDCDLNPKSSRMLLVGTKSDPDAIPRIAWYDQGVFNELETDKFRGVLNRVRWSPDGDEAVLSGWQGFIIKFDGISFLEIGYSHIYVPPTPIITTPIIVIALVSVILLIVIFLYLIRKKVEIDKKRT